MVHYTLFNKCDVPWDFKFQVQISAFYNFQKRRVFLNDHCWEVYFLLKISNLIDWIRASARFYSNLRFLVKNTLLNNSHLERFNTVGTPFPMERHILFNENNWAKKFDYENKELLKVPGPGTCKISIYDRFHCFSFQ